MMARGIGGWGEGGLPASLLPPTGNKSRQVAIQRLTFEFRESRKTFGGRAKNELQRNRKAKCREEKKPVRHSILSKIREGIPARKQQQKLHT